MAQTFCGQGECCAAGCTAIHGSLQWNSAGLDRFLQVTCELWREQINILNILLVESIWFWQLDIKYGRHYGVVLTKYRVCLYAGWASVQRLGISWAILIWCALPHESLKPIKRQKLCKQEALDALKNDHAEATYNMGQGEKYSNKVNCRVLQIWVSIIRTFWIMNTGVLHGRIL